MDANDLKSKFREQFNGWRRRLDRWNYPEGGAGEVFVFLLLSLIHILLFIPFEMFYRTRSTARYRQLAHLSIEDLCQELDRGGDFDRFTYATEPDERLKTEERGLIASHISEQCAFGALAAYPQLLQIVSYKEFWDALYAHEAWQVQLCLFVGFYLGVGVTVLVVWLF